MPGKTCRADSQDWKTNLSGVLIRVEPSPPYRQIVVALYPRSKYEDQYNPANLFSLHT
jgi:hypothetical protein